MLKHGLISKVSKYAIINTSKQGISPPCFDRLPLPTCVSGSSRSKNDESSSNPNRSSLVVNELTSLLIAVPKDNANSII